MKKQRGAALILFVTVLVLGVAWYAVGALGKAPVAKAERESRTGLALQAAKQALLSYAAQYAARTDHNVPGRMPCPEPLAAIGTSSEGEEPQIIPPCSNSTVLVGRLPWRTLGIDQLRDGDGEPLWYVLSPGFRSAPINFATPGQLTYNGVANAAVALIIAPGRPLNAGGCNTTNQQVSARNTAPLAVANFLECGNETGNYANPGTSEWTNDRVVSITAAEWADAIAGSVADRLQRETLAALRDWDSAQASATAKSWGTTWGLAYLPFATTFGNPTSSNYCGNGGVREGLAPLAASSPGTCDTRWTGAGSAVLGLIPNPCTQEATYLSCTFLRVAGALQPATVTATATNIANGFHGTINALDLTITPAGYTINSFTMSISPSTGTATAVIDITFAPLPIGATSEVRVPYVADATVLSDSRVTWVTNNTWQRYLYYAVAPGATVNPTSVCAAAGDPGCITVSGLPSSTGNTNDKRLVLALSGRALAGQAQPSGSIADYLESRVSGTQFTSATVTNAYNDRLAACPFQYTPQSGSAIPICN